MRLFLWFLNTVSLAFCVLLKHLKHQFWKKKELVRRAKIKLTQITNALLCIFCQKLRRRWGLNFDILWMTLVLLLLLFLTTTGTEQKMWWWSNFEQLIFFAFVAEIAKLKRNTVVEKIKISKPTNTFLYLTLDFTLTKYYF